MTDLAAATLQSKSRLSHQITRMETAGLVKPRALRVRPPRPVRGPHRSRHGDDAARSPRTMSPPCAGTSSTCWPPRPLAQLAGLAHARRRPPAQAAPARTGRRPAPRPGPPAGGARTGLRLPTSRAGVLVVGGVRRPADRDHVPRGGHVPGDWAAVSRDGPALSSSAVPAGGRATRPSLEDVARIAGGTVRIIDSTRPPGGQGRAAGKADTIVWPDYPRRVIMPQGAAPLRCAGHCCGNGSSAGTGRPGPTG